jgi:hypothetical protein
VSLGTRAGRKEQELWSGSGSSRGDKGDKGSRRGLIVVGVIIGKYRGEGDGQAKGPGHYCIMCHDDVIIRDDSHE